MRLDTNTQDAVLDGVLNEEPQHCALMYSAFDIIDDRRLDSENPLTLHEMFNAEENVTPGNFCTANLEAHVVNRDGVMSGFNYARNFLLMFGVETDHATISNVPNLKLPVIYGGVVVSIENDTNIYCALTSDMSNGITIAYGSAMQSGEKFVALHAFGNVIHAITNKQRSRGRIDINNNAQTLSDKVNSFTVNISLSDAAYDRIIANANGNITEQWVKYSAYFERKTFTLNGSTLTTDTTTFVPQYVFKGIQPRKVLGDDINITASDITTLFDRDATPFIDTAFSTAKTRADMVSDILALIATETGVTFTAENHTFSTDTYDDNPFEGYDGYTYRDLMKLIAESSGLSVRVKGVSISLNESGTTTFSTVLDFCSMNPSNVAYLVNADEYYDFEADEYSVQSIQKVRVQASDEDVGVILPNSPAGDNGIAIIDNPLLIGDNETEIKARCTRIFPNLKNSRSGGYYPGTLQMDSWLIAQPGDAFNIQNYIIYIFTLTTTWNGFAECTVESTGEKTREVLTKTIKQKLRNGRRWHDFEVSVDGLTSRMGNAEGDISDLQSTAEALTLRMTNAEGDITAVQAEAGKLVLEVSGLDSSQIFRDTRFMNALGQDGNNGVNWDNSKWGRAVGSATSDYTRKNISDCPDARVTRAIRMLTSTTYDTAIYQDKIPVIGGKKYIVSGYFRASVTGAYLTITEKDTPGATLDIGFIEYTQTDNKWQRFTASVWPGSSTKSVKIGFVMPNASGAWFELCGLKMELGSTATAWTEADEFTFSRITQSAAELLTEMSDALGNYYTKSETASKIQTDMTDALGNYYTKTETASEISTYVGNNAYGIKSGIAIKTAGVEISGGKYVKIISGSFICNSGNFSISDAGELTAGSYKLSQNGLVYNNGTSSFGITAAKAGTTNLGTALTSNGHIKLVPQSGNNGYLQLYSDSTVLQLLPQPLVGSSGGITKVRNSILGGGAATDIWDEGYFVDLYYTNTYQNSSREVKKDITPLDISGDVIDGLKPVSFRYKERDERVHFGLIHEDTLPIFPEICKGDADTPPQKKAIDYSELIAVLLSEVQKLRARVAALES